ncbi:MAG: stage II sporulation protein M [Nanoarchaeota archaeon]|nr:stage II sporulation protein M [Nanoarchaeota archaeon]
MVLESLIAPKQHVSKSKALLIGFIFTSTAILLSLWIFQDFASLAMVFLTVLAAFPFIYNTIKIQEEEDLTDLSEKTILKDHSKALTTFLFLFFGFVIAFSVWYVILPTSMTNILFKTQADTILNINTRLAPNVVNPLRVFSVIFFNNLKVLIFCILFSFIYGAGALFILTWNASVIGTAIGNFIRSNLAQYAAKTGLAQIGAYFHVFSLGLLRYSIHGIPEILAYFTAGFAGSIISVAVIQHNFQTKKFGKILVDSSDLLLISLLLLFISALLEVFITPLFFG